MRKFHIEKIALEIIKKGEHLLYHDQTLMNNIFKNYIGIFPFEYHTRNWINFESVKQFNNVSVILMIMIIFIFQQNILP